MKIHKTTFFKKNNIRHLILNSFVTLILIFLLAPLIIIPILSFGESSWFEFPPTNFSLKWYKELFSSRDWLDPVLNSLKIAIPVVIISLIIATPVSYVITRGTGKGKEILNSLFSTPMLMPHIVFAVAVYSVYLTFNINGTLFGIVMAHVVIALPFVITNISNALRTMNIAIEQAALSCGAGHLTTFFKITLPITKNGFISGAIYAFIMSWDDVIIAIFITTPKTMTLPVKMWNSLNMDFSPMLAAVSTILLIIVIIILLILTLTGNIVDRKESGGN